jgi:hypothetical protein
MYVLIFVCMYICIYMYTYEVVEVLGHTIDVVLVNGTLKEVGVCVCLFGCIYIYIHIHIYKYM